MEGCPLRNQISLSAVVAGFVTVLVSYAGPSVLIFQAASAAGLDHGQVASWIWAVSIGTGVSAILLSIHFRAPIITAWSTPGVAFLVAALPQVPYAEAIGAFMVAAGLLTLLGLSGLFEVVTARIPRSIASAMLAGILFHFGVQVFTAFPGDPLMVGLMILAYLILKRVAPRYAIAGVLLTGLGFAWGTTGLDLGTARFDLATPQWVSPVFTWEAVTSIGLPLALLTLTGQFVPGLAVLRASGYALPAKALVWLPSALSIPLAALGGHGVNLAAITAAICTGPESHPDPNRRWVAGVVAGSLYIVVGAFGATLALVFAALPEALVVAVAGLALLGAIMGGLSAAMAVEKEREAALVTFLVTASGMTFLGLGAAFWGLVVGLVAHLALREWRPREIVVQPAE
jgi:benzoate membrane transport protein